MSKKSYRKGPYDDEDGLDEEVEESSSDESEFEEEGFLIKIDTLMGTHFHLLAYPSDTIELLKTRIAFQEGIPQNDQNLLLPNGKSPLDNNSLLSELGIDLTCNNENEFCSSLRLVTSVSTGLPRTTSTTATQLNSRPPSLPFIPSWLRRIERETGSPPPPHQNLSDDLKLPPLTDNNIDGLIVLRDRNDQRVFLIIKRSTNAHSGIGSGPASRDNNADETDQLRQRRHVQRDILQQSNDVCEIVCNGPRELSQLERIRENAKTLHKMTQIRQRLIRNRKKGSKLIVGTKEEEEENGFPDINKSGRFDSPRTVAENSSSPAVPKSAMSSSRGGGGNGYSTNSTMDFSRSTLTSSMANLNRLKAEIYLEARKLKIGGSSGQLPYTTEQLCKYVQLKVKILLDHNSLIKHHPDDFSTRFLRSTLRNPHGLIPTVVLNRKSAGYTARTFVNRGTSGKISTGRRSDKSDGQGESKENNIDWSILSSSSTSEKSMKRAQQTVILSNVKLGSADGRPQSGARPLSSGGIQKKRKKKGGGGISSSAVVRCEECRKRIGLACRYQCRCGRLFCSTHRYAETHGCSFDYKAEGRRELRQSNPLVTPNKVPEI